MVEYKAYHELDIWKYGYALLMKIYKITDTFPKTEVYALTSQIQRSANSIIANIAESHGRYSYKDKIRVLYIARAELIETQSHLAVSLGIQYINTQKFSEINEEYKILHKELNTYIKSLSNC